MIFTGGRHICKNNNGKSGRRLWRSLSERARELKCVYQRRTQYLRSRQMGETREHFWQASKRRDDERNSHVPVTPLGAKSDPTPYRMMEIRIISKIKKLPTRILMPRDGSRNHLTSHNYLCPPQFNLLLRISPGKSILALAIQPRQMEAAQFRCCSARMETRRGADHEMTV